MKSRRSLLVTVMSILLIAAVLLPTFLFASPASADTPTKSWTKSGKTAKLDGNTIFTTTATMSLAWYGPATWVQADGAWQFKFRMAGTGAMRGSNYRTPTNYWKVMGVQTATMSIKPTTATQAGFKTILTGQYVEDIGSIPATYIPNPAYEGVADAVVSYAVDAIGLIPGLGYIGFAWTTAQLIAGFRSGYDSATTNSYEVTRKWSWGGGTPDVAQYLVFRPQVYPNKRVQFNVYYTITTPYNKTNVVLGPYTRTITTPGPSQSATPVPDVNFAPSSNQGSTQKWNPGMMTAAEKKTYGIEEIQISQLTSQRASELNISPETIRAAQAAGETVIYIARNLEIK